MHSNIGQLHLGGLCRSFFIVEDTDGSKTTLKIKHTVRAGCLAMSFKVLFVSFEALVALESLSTSLSSPLGPSLDLVLANARYDDRR